MTARLAMGETCSRLGFTVSQVVHDYGDICQAITELAVEQNAPITTKEFHILNRCLDTAIADAVTEHARITAESRSADDSDAAAVEVDEREDAHPGTEADVADEPKGSVVVGAATASGHARNTPRSPSRPVPVALR